MKKRERALISFKVRSSEPTGFEAARGATVSDIAFAYRNGTPLSGAENIGPRGGKSPGSP